MLPNKPMHGHLLQMLVCNLCDYSLLSCKLTVRRMVMGSSLFLSLSQFQFSDRQVWLLKNLTLIKRKKNLLSQMAYSNERLKISKF